MFIQIIRNLQKFPLSWITKIPTFSMSAFGPLFLIIIFFIPGHNLQNEYLDCNLAFKWMLILATVASNNTLVWKIWKRKSLHTIFNLSFCFYFFWSGMFGPFLFYEYGNLLDEMIKHPDTSCPTLCHRVLVYRILICQALKVFIINILYR